MVGTRKEREGGRERERGGGGRAVPLHQHWFCHCQTNRPFLVSPKPSAQYILGNNREEITGEAGATVARWVSKEPEAARRDSQEQMAECQWLRGMAACKECLGMNPKGCRFKSDVSHLFVLPSFGGGGKDLFLDVADVTR